MCHTDWGHRLVVLANQMAEAGGWEPRGQFRLVSEDCVYSSVAGTRLTCKTLAFILGTDKKEGRLGNQFQRLGGDAFSLLCLLWALESYHILGACKNHQTRTCFIFNNHCFINFGIYYLFIINYCAHEYLQTCPGESQRVFHACLPNESCLQLVCFCLTYRLLLQISSSCVLKCPPHILEWGRHYLLVRNCWISFP